MSADFTRLLEKLIPTPDAEGAVRMRTGVVDEANADGTVDLNLSGVVIEDVPTLAGAVFTEGQIVQVISARGYLLVLGAASGAAASAGLGLWARGQATSQQTGITTSMTTLLTTDTKTFVKDRVYEVKSHGGVSGGAGTYADLRAYRSGSTELGEFYRIPIPTASVVFNATVGGLYFTVSADVSGAVQLRGAASSGTMAHFGNGATPRNVEVWDVGDISKFPGVTTW